jgi:hypothetical protein
MFEHVSLWELYADSKDADGEDNPGQFEGNMVLSLGISPGSRVKDSGTVWA